jgi:signal peptidase I
VGLYTRLPVNRRPVGCLIEIAETVILTVIIFLAIQTFVAQPYRVEQESMRDTLEPDEYVLVDKLTPRFDDYSRGDIIVFRPVVREESCDAPPNGDEADDEPPFIKRVIGVAGDHVELRDGNVLVNGAQLDEPYIKGSATRSLTEQSEWDVMPNRLFVMGDNRDNSTDSRSDQIGPICQADVIGRAWLRYWPINTLGILATPTYPNVPPATGAATPASSADTPAPAAAY